jgi:hypothetical protein
LGLKLCCFIFEPLVTPLGGLFEKKKRKKRDKERRVHRGKGGVLRSNTHENAVLLKQRK